MLPERRISAAAELDGVMHACAAGQVCAPAAQHKVSKQALNVGWRIIV